MEVATDLRTNPHVTDVAVVPFLTPGECHAVVASCDATAWTDRSEEAKQPLVAAQRGLAQPVASEDVRERIAGAVSRVNDAVFGFRLTEIESPVRVMRYDAEHRGHIAPHLDVGASSPLRKLSFSILLSDPSSFEGGDLAFQTGRYARARVQGVLTVWPSFLMHHITPVTAGCRDALVGYVLGPTFV